MRIAVVSTGATLSTYTLNQIAEKLNLTNYEEFYNQLFVGDDDVAVAEANAKLYDTDNYCIKLMTSGLHYNEKINYNNINWEVFNKIVFTERQSLTDQVLSLYTGNLGIRSSLNTNTPIHVEISDEAFIQVKNHFVDIKHMYQTYKTELIQRFPDKCVTINYETVYTEEYVTKFNSINNTNFLLFNFVSPHAVVNAIRTGTPFRNVISNYSEIEENITNHTD